ncbi:MAG TPA: response regulator transcription factor [Opitutus sp.]|nr:response regulator transcription factor [Opitutus sp.]
MNFHGSILLVDDEPHIRKFVSLILKSIGAAALIEAGDGAAAVEVYQRETPDLVLLDISMPVMDGLETLRRLREIDPDCVVIMLTSIVNRQSVDEALTLGAVAYIRKDTPKEEIARTLVETIDACFEGDEGES